MTPGEYLKWVELVQALLPVDQGLCEPHGGEAGVGGDGLTGPHFLRAAAEKFARAQKNMRLAVIENCGHVCSIEAPELFNDLVLKFLADQDVPARVTANPIPSTWAELKALKG